MNIRSTPINHKQIYNLRTHGDKLSGLAGPFPSLVSFLEEMHENCPAEPFFSGPRSSSIHAGPVPVYDQLETHLRCEHTSQGLQVNANRFAERHEQVQVYMLENDACTIAMEVPLWIDYQEAGVFQTLMTTDQFLSGHVDVLAIEEGLVWIWDYKPNAHKERWVHVQLSAYALMLSHRTGISLENIRCGYFDDQSCFTFTPRQAHIDCFDFYSFVPADQNRQTLFQQKPAKYLMPRIIFDEQGLYSIDIPDPPPEPQRRAGSGVGRAPAGSFRIIKDGDTTTFEELGIEKPESSLHLSTLYSWHLFVNEQKSLPEIADLRRMNESTISGHLCDAALDGLMDPLLVVNQQTVVRICECINSLPEDAEGRLKPIFLALKEEFDYGKIKCAIALGNRDKLILNRQYV
jgi:hypothetical protein